MKNKYLWIFVSNFGDVIFPLFWSDRNIGCIDYDDLNEDYKKKIDYLFSDNPDNIKPEDGYIISWSHLDLLDDESVLSELP